LYFAGRAAIRMVAEVLDIPIEEVTWQVSRDPPAMFLEHTLGLVELRIAFTKLASHQKWSEFEWLPEPLCRHEYSVRNGTRWACQILKPDAFACWKIGAQEFCHFIELDLGHVSQRVFRSKVQGYQRYHSLGLFTEAYGSSSFSVLVITTGQRRIESLLSAVQPGLSPFFLFATFSSLRELGPAGASWRSAEGHASPFGGNQ
jgi:hypothetical protein